MSERNKVLMRRFYDEVFNDGRVELIDELCASDFVEHEEQPDLPPGREGVRQIVTMMRTAFPDLTFVVEDMIAEGDKVVARLTMSGTQRGAFMSIPASGKSFSVTSIDIVRIDDGRMTEHWGVTDTASMLEQLGAIPAPEG